MITDHYNRNIDYIRISITDRCNLRCRYFMPEDISFVGHDKILRYEEITRIVQILAQRDYKGKDYRWGAAGAARMHGFDP